MITTEIKKGSACSAQQHADAGWTKIDPDLEFPGGSCPVSTCRYDLNEISASAELQTGIAGGRSREALTPLTAEQIAEPVRNMTHLLVDKNRRIKIKKDETMEEVIVASRQIEIMTEGGVVEAEVEG